MERDPRSKLPSLQTVQNIPILIPKLVYNLQDWKKKSYVDCAAHMEDLIKNISLHNTNLSMKKGT